jgi:hypothetical protein
LKHCEKELAGLQRQRKDVKVLVSLQKQNGKIIAALKVRRAFIYGVRVKLFIGE